MIRLAIIVLNYRRAELTTGCLESLVSEVAGREDRHVVLVDNGSDDDSADVLEKTIAERGWSGWITFVRNPVNGGFAAGNNLGMKTVEAEIYLLLNSDARAREGSIDGILEAVERHPNAGMLGPRLEDPDGTPQNSCFRYRTPISEMLAAAGTGPLTRVFSNYAVATGVAEEPCEPPWVSFACVAIPREVIERVGLMDESYFMYFEDLDYARQVRKAGYTIVHDPAPRVVHLRGGSSSVKSAISSRKRVPKYYYESRSRYYAKFYGGVVGLWMTNVLWLCGRTVSALRELVGNKEPHSCSHEGSDNWTNWLRPLQQPQLPTGGEM